MLAESVYSVGGVAEAMWLLFATVMQESVEVVDSELERFRLGRAIVGNGAQVNGFSIVRYRRSTATPSWGPEMLSVEKFDKNIRLRKLNRVANG